MTLAEVTRAIKAYGKREDKHNKNTKQLVWLLPQLIAKAVVDGKDYPKIYKIFDGFDDLQEMDSVNNFLSFASAYNNKLNEENS